MNETISNVRATLERVRCQVMALLAKTPRLDVQTLYGRVREALGQDTDMEVARVISTLLRAHVISLEPLTGDPDSGMCVELV